MARAFPQSQTAPDDRDPNQWQSLRHELVALLDQVDSQVSRNRGENGLTDRVRDLRRQVGDDLPDARHRDALRSVQRQINRFGDPGPALPPNPRESLEAAISQIRSRQTEPSRMSVVPPAPAPIPTPRIDTAMLDKLAISVNGIAGRLERLEGEIHAQVKTGADIKDVASQVSQLAHVVELLAGAVGETGQVKRLEGQIASLGRVIAQGREMDLGALNRRLDDVASTVGKLAELQVHYVDKVESPLVGQAFQDGMRGIEDSVRAVYDRIDTLEHTSSLAPHALEEMTAAMAAFTDAMRDQNVAPQGLVELIDALNGRIAELENGDRLVLALRKDLTTLRDAVLVSLAPRFEAIERRMDDLGTRDDMAEIGRQIELLSDRLGDGPGDVGIGALEAQVRQLVARMDQTGEQLSGLARLYTEPAAAAMPDIHELANLVAERAAAAMPRTTDTGISNSLAALEARISDMLGSMQQDPEVNDFGGVRAGIDEVNERLKRLEASLQDRRDIATIGGDEIGAIIAAADIVPARNTDEMPRDPRADAPLIDPPFPEPAGPVQEALGAKAARKRHPGLDEDSLAARHDQASPPQATPQRAPIPAAPLPSSGYDANADGSEPALPASRSTFIEAHRRAAAQRQPGKPQPSPNSLIGRALSRFQLAGSTEASEPLPVPPAKSRAPEPVPQRIEPVAMATPNAGPEAVIDAAASEPAEQGSFLLRHRKAILLTAALIAVAFLAVNLIAQRINAPADPAAPDMSATPATTGDIAPPPDVSSAMDALTASMPPRVIPLTSTMQTGAIDGSTSPAFTPSPIPSATSSFSAGDVTSSALAEDGDSDGASTAALDPEAPSSLAPPAAAAATPDAPTATATPATIAAPDASGAPPDNVGPAELRQAAANGDAHAEFEIAAIYTEGRVVTQDYGQAATWYQRAADQGFAPAEYRLGSLYESGKGVTKDLNIALQWYEKAALAGNRMSMHNLASLYAGGALGKQQFDKAAQWFEEAANLGLTDSQFNLGMLYARGLGVPQSLEGLLQMVRDRGADRRQGREQGAGRHRALARCRHGQGASGGRHGVQAAADQPRRELCADRHLDQDLQPGRDHHQ